MEKKILTFKEAAEFMGLSESYLYKLTSLKKITFYRPIGKLIYFLKSDLEAFLLQNKVSTADELESKAQSYCMAHKMGGH